MDARPLRHPDDPTLRAFGLGTLDDDAAEAVARHLETCPDCLRRVAGLSSDSFLARLRRAHSAAVEAPAPAGAGAGDRAATVPPPRSARPIPPELANHPDYRIRRELVGGAMGRVFLAHNRLMGRDEILKLIGPEFVELDGVRDRFHREIRTVARLRHPNIVTAYTAFRAGEDLVFAMEYVDGRDLARLVRARGPMPIGRACLFIHQAALGLQHAHEKGLVHRDIKPGNLMLAYKGGRAVIKVLDFGLAKAGGEPLTRDVRWAGAPDVAASPSGELTLAGQMLGTPDFIAPEQIADAQAADIRADIYSLGCTLYYLLAGRPPFPSRTLREVLRAHRTAEARPLNLVRPEVPAELAALAARMMAKDPADRFQTPKAVADALTPFFEEPPAAVAGFESAQAAAADDWSGPPDPTWVEAGPVALPGAEAERGMWSSLIEFKDTEPAPAAGRRPARSRSRRLAPALAAAGMAAALLAVVLSRGDLRGLGFRGPAVGSPRTGPADRTPGTPARDGRIGHGAIGTPHPREGAAPTGTGRSPVHPDDRPAAARDPVGRAAVAISRAGASPGSPAKAGDLPTRARPVEPPHDAEGPDPQVGSDGRRGPRWSDSHYILGIEEDVLKAAEEVASRATDLRRTLLDRKADAADRKQAERETQALIQRRDALLPQQATLRAAHERLKQQHADADEATRRYLEATQYFSTTAIMRADRDQKTRELDELRSQLDRAQALLDGVSEELDGVNRGIAERRRNLGLGAGILDVQGSAGSRRAAYVQALEDLRQRVDEANRQYRVAAGDVEVQAAIATRNRGLPARRHYKLGPSPKFIGIEKKLREHEDWLKSGETRRPRRGHAQEPSSAAGDLPPAFAS